jgi:hypothetical protein
MGRWLKCEDCDGHFDKKGDKVYIFWIDEVQFTKDGEYEKINERQVQLCENCLTKNPIYEIFKKQNRMF